MSSMILAISIGISTAVWEDFNFGSALVVFVVCVFNVLVMTVILFGIKNVLSENKDISSQKKNIENPSFQQPGDI